MSMQTKETLSVADIRMNGNNLIGGFQSALERIPAFNWTTLREESKHPKPPKYNITLFSKGASWKIPIEPLHSVASHDRADDSRYKTVGFHIQRLGGAGQDEVTVLVSERDDLNYITYRQSINGSNTLFFQNDLRVIEACNLVLKDLLAPRDLYLFSIKINSCAEGGS